MIAIRARNRISCVRLFLSFLGAFFCAIILSIIRFYGYVYRGEEPNMSPVFIVIFSPIFGLFFGFIGVIVEILLNKFFVPSRTNLKAFLYGACYSMPLLYLIDWRLIVFMLCLNPIVLRLNNK